MAGGPPFGSYRDHHGWGAPSLRPLQGWVPRTHTSGAFAIAQLGWMRRNENAISRTRCCRQHRTRPCTKRKDGAPSVVLASAIQRAGHPPYVWSFRNCPAWVDAAERERDKSNPVLPTASYPPLHKAQGRGTLS